MNAHTQWCKAKKQVCKHFIKTMRSLDVVKTVGISVCKNIDQKLQKKHFISLPSKEEEATFRPPKRELRDWSYLQDLLQHLKYSPRSIIMVYI